MNYVPFLDSFFEQIAKVGLNVDGLPLDHIAYQASSKKDYEIPALELIEPKDGQECKSDFQHAEFVMEKSFQDYLDECTEINWDKSSMNRNEFPHLKINFENVLTL